MAARVVKGAEAEGLAEPVLPVAVRADSARRDNACQSDRKEPRRESKSHPLQAIFASPSPLLRRDDSRLAHWLLSSPHHCHASNSYHRNRKTWRRVGKHRNHKPTAVAHLHAVPWQQPCPDNPKRARVSAGNILGCGRARSNTAERLTSAVKPVDGQTFLHGCAPSAPSLSCDLTQSLFRVLRLRPAKR